MLKDITLGQYFPGTSVIHRLDPRTKLLAVILYIVALFNAKTVITYGIVILCLALCVAVSRVSFRANAFPLGSRLSSYCRLHMRNVALFLAKITPLYFNDSAIASARATRASLESSFTVPLMVTISPTYSIPVS